MSKLSFSLEIWQAPSDNLGQNDDCACRSQSVRRLFSAVTIFYRTIVPVALFLTPRVPVRAGNHSIRVALRMSARLARCCCNGGGCGGGRGLSLCFDVEWQERRGHTLTRV